MRFNKRDLVNNLLIYTTKMVESTADNELPKHDITLKACATPDCVKKATM
jgi:hypothetical protein